MSVPIPVVIMDDHVTEHLIKDPLHFKTGQAFFIKDDFDGVIDKDMGMRDNHRHMHEHHKENKCQGKYCSILHVLKPGKAI